MSPRASTGAPSPDPISIRGARTHNLRDIDVDLPRNRFIVITGPSGSGKSSLAFDTLYAEGQRRYVESLSAYARQFLDQMPRPEVESIDGLSPAISIEQKSTSPSRRSTVGTLTEIADAFRLLYARIGEPHCTGCGAPVSGQSIHEMVERLLALVEGTRVQILAPVVRNRKGAYRKELDGWRRKGFARVRIDGEFHELADEIAISRAARHDIDLVIDQIRIKERIRARLGESLRTATELADGLVRVLAETADSRSGVEESLLSQNRACLDCGISFSEPSPGLFSFNSPSGACPGCSGLGVVERFDAERIVTDPGLSLAGGAIEPWKSGRNTAYYDALLESLARHYAIATDTPWRELDPTVRAGILIGKGKPEIEWPASLVRSRSRPKKSAPLGRCWKGVVDELERRAASDERAAARLARYRTPHTCSDCGGARLRDEARAVTIGGLAIHELFALPISELAERLPEWAGSAVERAIAEPIFHEIGERLDFLRDVGLDYLSLDRTAPTLSGGETQRIRLAAQIGSRLMGVLYILDEPSIGLHARDHGRLLEALLRLRDMGNSLVVVEHDESTIRSADHVVDMGPGAGAHGGRIVAQGRPEALAADESSATGAYLAGRRRIPIPERRRSASKLALEIRGCSANNLDNLDLRIPIGLFTVVTGVSGSGKSTLINDTLYRALAHKLHGSKHEAGPFRELAGLEFIDKVIGVDQSPIGRSPRSNPATYSGAFDAIRRLFAQVPESRVRGYGPGRFSFNVKEGRCADCEGNGVLRVEMHFLPDHFIRCETCRGRRYNEETLAILYGGHTIAEVLEMTVEEGLERMGNAPALRRPLEALIEVGLGYIHLGQAATTLSGGEAQRVKLARELARRTSGRTLYVLDEPTTGLHFVDVENLLAMLSRLVDMGNTVAVIEHHADVILAADHVIDLGPGGGNAGGRIVVEGTPEQVIACTESHTGRALAAVQEARG